MISSPWKRIEPSSAGTRPVITLNSVDLPDPFGPITATTLPFGTMISTLFSAVRPPNFTVTSWISSAASPVRTSPPRPCSFRSVKPPRLISACCWSMLSAACGRVAGISPCRRNSIIPTRIRPKISSIDGTRSTCWNQSLLANRPNACSHSVRSCSHHDCRSCRMNAPSTTPHTLPMPPNTIITRIITDTGKPNISGVAVCSLAT